MESIYLNMPFMVLSSKVNPMGETEIRVLTPFGIIDLTFRKTSNTQSRGTTHFDIEVDGDTEHWILYDNTIAEFKTALLKFIGGVAQKYLKKVTQYDFHELRVHVKGAELNLRMPCGVGAEEPTSQHVPDDI